MGRVVGVMKDYHQTGMYNEVESLMLLYRLQSQIIYVKLSGNETEDFREQFSNDRNRRAVFAGFTILTIFIACLGLFGLASYTTERRTREIGPQIFIWTILLILIPTALTVSFQSYKAATANPANSMRNE